METGNTYYVYIWDLFQETTREIWISINSPVARPQIHRINFYVNGRKNISNLYSHRSRPRITFFIPSRQADVYISFTLAVQLRHRLQKVTGGDLWPIFWLTLITVRRLWFKKQLVHTMIILSFFYLPYKFSPAIRFNIREKLSYQSLITLSAKSCLVSGFK